MHISVHCLLFTIKTRNRKENIQSYQGSCHDIFYVSYKKIRPRIDSARICFPGELSHGLVQDLLDESSGNSSSGKGQYLL